MVCTYNFITVGIAIIISLLVLYFLSRLFIYFSEKYLTKKSLLFAYALIILSLFFPSLFLTYSEQKSCEKEKEKNPHYKDRHAMIEFGIERSVSDYWFENAKKKLGIFYFINGISYLYDGAGSARIVALTKEGEEVQKACELEANPYISSVWPASMLHLYGSPIWKERRDSICKAKGFGPGEINQCTEFMLKDSDYSKELAENGFDYEVDDSGKIITEQKSMTESLGHYSDANIIYSLGNKKSQYEGAEPSKTGANMDEIKSGRFVYQYDIRKVSGYEKIEGVTFSEPFMSIYVPNNSDKSVDDMYQAMWPQLQIISEQKITFGKYDYIRKNVNGAYGFEYAIYDSQIGGRKIKIVLMSRPYFEKDPDLQKEFEEIIASLEFKFESS
jgi:hypothetical protein